MQTLIYNKVCTARIYVVIYNNNLGLISIRDGNPKMRAFVSHQEILLYEMHTPLMKNNRCNGVFLNFEPLVTIIISILI